MESVILMEENKTRDWGGLEMSKCTCWNRKITAKVAQEEALSAVDKTTSVVMGKSSSSVSLGEGGVDLWSLCLTFQLKLLKVPAHTQ